MCRRCAAPAALNDGWGEAAGWLAGVSPTSGPAASHKHSGTQPELTTREREVLALLAEGSTNKQIAGRLYLSPRTVEEYVERILTKTGHVNRTALAAYATSRRSTGSTPQERRMRGVQPRHHVRRPSLHSH